MGDKFIYIEKTGELYSPHGRFIKKVSCPKAKHWNQLIADDPSDRSRGCSECRERVLNLDVMDSLEAEQQLREVEDACVFASRKSENVLFLRMVFKTNQPSARLRHANCN